MSGDSEVIKNIPRGSKSAESIVSGVIVGDSNNGGSSTAASK